MTRSISCNRFPYCLYIRRCSVHREAPPGRCYSVMASQRILCKSCIFFICILVLLSSRVEGVLKIVEPLPGHSVAIENETLRVTCVVFDAEDQHVRPTGVNFFRVDKFGDMTRIVDQGPEGNYVFENRTEVSGRKLFVTMVIKRIKQSDSGQYRCMLPNNTVTSYGFGITYIAKSDLPEIKVSHNVTAELGESFSLACNITKKGNVFKVRLVAIAWVKDNQRIAEVPSAERNLKDLKLTMNKPEDAGHYKCELTSMLHAQRMYNITGVISVQVRPKFGAVDLRHNEIIRIKGEPVEFQCDATGNPIKIVWKRKPRNRNLLITFNETSYSNESLHMRYKFTRKSKYEGYKLEIPKTDYEDRGDYYCCIRSPNTSVPDQCQRFTLRVKDPLRHLWPMLGIIVEAVFLYIIIISSEKTKKINQKFPKSYDTLEDKPTADVRKEEKTRLRKTPVDQQHSLPTPT